MSRLTTPEGDHDGRDPAASPVRALGGGRGPVVEGDVHGLRPCRRRVSRRRSRSGQRPGSTVTTTRLSPRVKAAAVAPPTAVTGCSSNPARASRPGRTAVRRRGRCPRRATSATWTRSLARRHAAGDHGARGAAGSRRGRVAGDEASLSRHGLGRVASQVGSGASSARRPDPAVQGDRSGSRPAPPADLDAALSRRCCADLVRDGDARRSAPGLRRRSWSPAGSPGLRSANRPGRSGRRPLRSRTWPWVPCPGPLRGRDRARLRPRPRSRPLRRSRGRGCDGATSASSRHRGRTPLVPHLHLERRRSDS